MSRFLIGIDLGTTNCCVAYVDLLDPALAIHPFFIPQLNEAGYLEPLPTLPSFCYLGHSLEQLQKEFILPWTSSLNFAVGAYGKSRGAKVSTRLIQSAKSWLCHGAAQRREPILPLEAAENEIKLSPVDATMRYLQHLREAWDHTKGKDHLDSRFDQQEIVITVPASFDEIARRLTIEAAQKAGYLTFTLLEEPQAAFYSWISKNESVWMSRFSVGETILVCDVGGGTTDFSLIKVIETAEGKGFDRNAIGNHLLLGGDNIDAAIAHLIESKIHVDLSTSQWSELKHKAREAKEALLGNGAEKHTVVIQGTGSSVVKGSLSIDINKKEIESLIINGFFNLEAWESASLVRPSKGIKTVGLPYEDEPSITRHMAQFIDRSGMIIPNYLLFNGGTMKPKLFQDAVVNSLKHWFPENQIQVLDSVSLDFAVARGSAYFGKVKKGLGTKIGGGSARGYYLGLDVKSGSDSEKKLMVLLPKGSEDGACYDPDYEFQIKPNTPVSFELYTSHTRRDDRCGQFYYILPEEFQPLPPIHTVLHYGKQGTTWQVVPVKLHVALTTYGTLDLSLKSISTPHQWNLQFEIRGTSEREKVRHDETFDIYFLNEAKHLIEVLYSESSEIFPKEIFERLENVLGRKRDEWPLTILRGLWESVFHVATRRKKTEQHEARWWNLAGYFLRPGFGYPLDEMRLKELWKIILEDFHKDLYPDVMIQFWVCCRRVAGGLNRGQQLQLGNKILPTVLHKNGKIVDIPKKELYPYHEKIRTLASFELLEKKIKIQLANAIIYKIKAKKIDDPELWALGRLGGRHLIYGSLANMIEPTYCVEWINKLLDSEHIESKYLQFAIEQLSRKTDVREMNVPSTIFQRVLVKYPHLSASLNNVQELSLKEKETIMGDSLPSGISCVLSLNI